MRFLLDIDILYIDIVIDIDDAVHLAAICAHVVLIIIVHARLVTLAPVSVLLQVCLLTLFLLLPFLVFWPSFSFLLIMFFCVSISFPASYSPY